MLKKQKNLMEEKSKDKPKILVVDDEEMVRNLVQRTLEKAGYNVVTAVNGQEALDKVSQLDVSLVLLDIKMPGLNGFEVLRILRQQSNIPVIMLTAKREVTSAIDSFHLGADDYVMKPFRKGELLARISTKLRRAGTELTPPIS